MVDLDRTFQKCFENEMDIIFGTISSIFSKNNEVVRMESHKHDEVSQLCKDLNYLVGLVARGAARTHGGKHDNS